MAMIIAKLQQWVRMPEVSTGEIYSQMMAFSRTTTEKQLKRLLKVALNDLRTFRLLRRRWDASLRCKRVGSNGSWLF
jgi:hypothetical protein